MLITLNILTEKGKDWQAVIRLFLMRPPGPLGAARRHGRKHFVIRNNLNYRSLSKSIFLLEMRFAGLPRKFGAVDIFGVKEAEEGLQV